MYWHTFNSRKKDPKQVWEKFKSYLYDPQYVIVGQNLLGFDVYMLAIIQRLIGEDVDYSYKQYNYCDLAYMTPLKCERYFNFMVDPNMPNTLGCYIKLDDMKKYYNPALTDCPSIWNYNIEKDGIKYCRRNGANLPKNV